MKASLRAAFLAATSSRAARAAASVKDRLSRQAARLAALPATLSERWRAKDEAADRIKRIGAGLRGSPAALLAGLRLAVRGAALVVAGLAVAVLVLIALYRWVNPPISTLMLGQSIAGTSIERAWVPLERISPNLVKAVLLSEDGSFCAHRGVDLGALKEAIEHDRGGSTITMQVVKNLFLWPSRSYVRKAIEISLAYLVDAVWPKRRILEIYLNIAEWGDGIFGAEAAAQANFGKPAARLTPEEAALLAVALPNPLERTPGAPSLATSRLAGRLMLRMAASRASLTCALSSRPASMPQPASRRAPASAPRPEWRPEVRPETRPEASAARKPAPRQVQSKDPWDLLFPAPD